MFPLKPTQNWREKQEWIPGSKAKAEGNGCGKKLRHTGGIWGIQSRFCPLKGPENNNVVISVNIPEKMQGKAIPTGIQQNGLNSAERGRAVNEIWKN